MSVIPKIRDQKISFSAQGMKPLANVYVFIGDTDMSPNTEPAKKIIRSRICVGSYSPSIMPEQSQQKYCPKS